MAWGENTKKRGQHLENRGGASRFSPATLEEGGPLEEKRDETRAWNVSSSRNEIKNNSSLLYRSPEEVGHS